MIGRWLALRQPVWLERARIGAPLWLGPTGQLALAVEARWRPERIFVQLIVKLDEANTHVGAPIMTMGGYMARVGQWNSFDRKWRKELRKAALDHFHAREMAAHPFARKVVKIADDHLMAGFVVRLDKRDYDEVYRIGPWGGKAQPDSMYGLCFRFLLSACFEVGFHEYGMDLRLDFLVESGHKHEGAPNEIVRRLKKENLRGISAHLGTVTPMLKKESYGLQAADGLATGAAWSERPDGSSIPLVDITPAGTLAQVSQKSPTKVPIFRCHADRSQLTSLRDDMFALVEFKRQFGIRRNAEIAARKARSLPSSSGEEPS